MADSIPLLIEQVTTLFHRLRLAGIPLSLDQYMLMLRALELDLHKSERETLRDLCHMIWVEEAEETPLFDYHFDSVITATAGETPPVKTPDPLLKDQDKDKGGDQVDSGDGRDTEKQPDKTDPVKGSKQPDKPRQQKKKLDYGEAAKIARRSDDVIANFRTILQITSRDADLDYEEYVLSAEYLPVSRRQMQQSWRYLRRMIREGPPAEIDVNATVRKVARDGFFLSPVMRARRVNRSSLMMLLDQKGSMVPFHPLTRSLAETAVSAGHLTQVNVHYFHDCPPVRRNAGLFSVNEPYREHTVYTKPQCLGGRPASEVVAEFTRSKPAVIIFSDAGAARGGWDRERIDDTATFIYQLVTLGLDRIAWLNPMPRSRWEGSSAAPISEFVPMFCLDQEGMNEAIDVLRGRSPHQVQFESGP